MLGQTLLGLPQLLVGVYVQGDTIPTGITADLLQPPSWDRPDAMGGDADLDEVTPLRPLPEGIDPLKERLR